MIVVLLLYNYLYMYYQDRTEKSMFYHYKIVFEFYISYQLLYGYFNFSKGKQLDMLNLDEYFGNKDQRKKAREKLELMWFKNEKEN